MSQAKPGIVFAHGARADGSCFRMRPDGVACVAGDLPEQEQQLR